MKFYLLISVVFFFTACEFKKTNKSESSIDSLKTECNSNPNAERKTPTIDTINNLAEPKMLMALTANALQIVYKETGRTTEIAFGKPIDETVELVENILDKKNNNIGINGECGVGPLKMVSWDNGLTLAFKDEQTNDEWVFAGWYLTKGKGSFQKLTTMAGIGIGTTKSSMEEAIVIKVIKSSLGYEFSTSSGLYGILSGNTPGSTITDMWSGASCVFR